MKKLSLIIFAAVIFALIASLGVPCTGALIPSRPPVIEPPAFKTIILRRHGDDTPNWGNTAFMYHPGVTPDAGISDSDWADDLAYLRAQTNGLNINWSESLMTLKANSVFETVIGGDLAWYGAQASGVTFFNSVVTGQPSLKNFVANKWTGNGHNAMNAVIHELLIGLNQPEMIVNGTYIPGYYAGDFFNLLPGHTTPVLRPSDIAALQNYFGGTLAVAVPEPAQLSSLIGLASLGMLRRRRAA